VAFGEGESAFLAVDRVSTVIDPGEFVCIVGPSGCGKSTVMNVIAGFEPLSEGRALVDDVPVDGPGPERGMVFQQPTLFPWKTVRQNVAYGPRMMGQPRAAALRIADALLETVGLSAFADHRPHTLSGGMQQRVGIARALANRPGTLLMDEPFGALDAQTRTMMQENLLQIWSERRATVIFITHDLDEAIFLADRILLMSASPGRIIDDIPVDLPRPRDASLALTPAFIDLKARCLEPLRRESSRAFEQQSRTR
jgi:NitT/TauT family transport system ATP-binding protein